MKTKKPLVPGGGDDNVQTPPALARAIVNHFRPSGWVIEPCAGDIIDTCSKFLKREILGKFAGQFSNVVDVFGFSWLEKSRIDRLLKYKPNSWFPLTEPPYVTNTEIGDWLQIGYGVKSPRMYSMGFSHNNCKGFCVKAGLGQAYDVWKHFPHVYNYNERMQEKFFVEISPHGRFLKKNGKHISLKELRELFEKGYVPGTSQYTSCGG